jgi:hypothetical protein
MELFLVPAVANVERRKKERKKHENEVIKQRTRIVCTDHRGKGVAVAI